MSSIVYTPTTRSMLKRKLGFEGASAQKLRKRPRIQRGPLPDKLSKYDKEICERFSHIFTKEYIIGINAALDESHKYALDRNLIPDKNYFKKVQTHIKPRMRRLMFLKLTQLHGEITKRRKNASYSDRTLWQTFFIVDRYLSVVDVLHEDMKLVGLAAYSIACKLYEDCRRNRKVDFSRWFYEVSDEDVAEMERRIVITLDWEFTLPSSYDFIERFIRIAVHSVREERFRNRVKWLALYAMERVNLEEGILNYNPRIIAAACVLTALTCSTRKFRWSSCLVNATGYDENCEELMGLLKHIRSVIYSFENEEHGVVIRKYAAKERGAVSTLRSKDSRP